jgi:hypothetical protein
VVETLLLAAILVAAVALVVTKQTTLF